jgi:hypothetical protein
MSGLSSRGSTDSKLDLALKTNDHPEHDKLSDVLVESQAIGEFIDGLARLGLVLCEMPDSHFNRIGTRPVPTSRSIPAILAEWFGIDQDALEREKRSMIAAMGAMNR